MPTNEDIRKLEKRLHDEFLVPPLLFVQLEALVDNEARSDTAKQIFAELDERNTNMGDAVWIDAEDYFALKKQFKVD